MLLGACADVRAPSGGGEWTPETRLFASKCTACHAKPDPSSRDAAAWDTVLTQHEAYLQLRPEDREVLLRLLSR